MNLAIALLFAVLFWTFARCARILGDLAKDLQKVQARQRKALREIEHELLLNRFGRN
jgi:hypothetical protein